MSKPPVLRNPRKVLVLLAAGAVLFAVLYVAIGATGFLRTQQAEPPRTVQGQAEAPLERATN